MSESDTKPGAEAVGILASIDIEPHAISAEIEGADKFTICGATGG